MKQPKETKVSRPYRNVFEAMKFKNPEIALLKADLVLHIGQAIKKKKIQPKDAAQVARMSGKKLEKLLKGHFRKTSVGGLLKILLRLDMDINVTVKAGTRKTRTENRGKNATGGIIEVNGPTGFKRIGNRAGTKKRSARSETGSLRQSNTRKSAARKRKTTKAQPTVKRGGKR